MRKIFLFPIFVLFLAGLATAQPVDDDLPQITGCIALVNARVVTSPGKAPVVSTVVMRDGLITQMGTNLNIPADAYRIVADSLYVYPAFIDAFSSIGIKEPENEGGNQQGQGNRGQRPSFDADGNPPLEDAGITPYKSVRATFDAKEKSIADWRAQGFAITHVVPKGKMLPGKGSIVVLSGKEADQMLWKEDVSMFAQWTGAGGGYPSTVIGIMAKWRELYHNALQSVAHQSSYDNATLVSRPKYNQAQEALAPVVRKEMPVYFRAPKVKDISRAMAMQKDLGMRMIITDAEEAWYLKDQFKSGSIPLVLSLDLPEDKGEKKAETKAEAKGEEPQGPGQDGPGQPGPKAVKDTLNAEGVKEVKAEAEAKEKNIDSTKVIAKDTVISDPEKEAFEKKRAESLKAYQRQAGVLAKDGIAFSFGTMSVKTGDFSKNITTMIENGLPPETALKALTTQPASLLGIEKYCGTVEVGKMANVIVSTKPLFEKDAAIKYMVVEGSLYEYEVKEKKKEKGKIKNADAPVGLLEGTWSYTIESPDQKREGTFEFTDGAGELTGTITGEDFTTGNNELEGIVIDGTTASFTFDFDMGGQLIQLEFDLTLNGETFEGTVTVGDFGAFPISGTRTSKPN
ncbi:MAG TPA: amidohydrolase family protein [Saprospiraceae bacterium]|nr:amidohydrolase family protein [Saprospiraceae bacterium]